MTDTTSPTAAAVRRRRQHLARRPVPRAHRIRRPAEAHRRKQRRRRDHQPDDLRRGPRQGRGVRRAGRRAGRGRHERHGRRLRDHDRRRRRRLRHLHAPSTRQSGGEDGRVSIEVEPGLAHDADGHHRGGQAALRRRSTSPTSMIKIPATVEGLEAITDTIAAGISVNVTLIFSLERHRQVINAYLTGLEQAKAAGIDLSEHPLGRLLLRLARRHRDRQAPRRHRHRRGEGAQEQGRRRQRPARLRGVRSSIRVRARAGAARGRRQRAAPAVGLHRRQGPEPARTRST